MIQEVLRIVGTIAGIGGISLGILYLLYRDFLINFIRSAKPFETLSRQQATLLIFATIIFTFCIAIIGIYAGFVNDGGPIFFILLVVIVLLFVLSAMYILGKQMVQENEQVHHPPVSAEDQIFYEVYKRLKLRQFEDAERIIEDASEKSADYWYWMSRIALARDNKAIALEYVEKSLNLDEQHIYSIALKIRLILLSGGHYKGVDAKAFADSNCGLSNRLDRWLHCLNEKGMFSSSLITDSEMNSKCKFITYEWET